MKKIDNDIVKAVIRLIDQNTEDEVKKPVHGMFTTIIEGNFEVKVTHRDPDFGIDEFGVYINDVKMICAIDFGRTLYELLSVIYEKQEHDKHVQFKELLRLKLLKYEDRN